MLTITSLILIKFTSHSSRLEKKFSVNNLGFNIKEEQKVKILLWRAPSKEPEWLFHTLWLKSHCKRIIGKVISLDSPLFTLIILSEDISQNTIAALLTLILSALFRQKESESSCYGILSCMILSSFVMFWKKKKLLN